MFVDVSGSTKMYDQLGDEVAKQIVDKCLDQLQVVTEAHGGIVIKKIGDELMCRFDSVESAISAARISQSEISMLHAHGNTRISIRTGIHYGEVIEDDDDIFGDAVNIAARMAGIAKGGQVITTAATIKDLPPELSTQVRQIDITKVKGKQDKLAVYEVIWEQESTVTKVATELLSRGATKPKRLRLSFGSTTCELENDSHNISIGRDDDCDLVVNTALASRKHAYCELRRNNFLIVDQGTNGTYVSIAGGDEVYLRREEMVLQGKGEISLGKPIAETEAVNIIHFEC